MSNNVVSRQVAGAAVLRANEQAFLTARSAKLKPTATNGNVPNDIYFESISAEDSIDILIPRAACNKNYTIHLNKKEELI